MRGKGQQAGGTAAVPAELGIVDVEIKLLPRLRHRRREQNAVEAAADQRQGRPAGQGWERGRQHQRASRCHLPPPSAPIRSPGLPARQAHYARDQSVGQVRQSQARCLCGLHRCLCGASQWFANPGQARFQKLCRTPKIGENGWAGPVPRPQERESARGLGTTGGPRGSLGRMQVFADLHLSADGCLMP